MRSMTRRSFIAGSAVTAGLLGLAGCGTSSTTTASSLPDASSYPIDPDGDDVQAKWSSETVDKDKWTRVTQDGGATLGVMDASKIIQVDGYAFKDLNGNGKLDFYEDWRQPIADRAKSLADQLSIEEAAPLKFHGDVSMSSEKIDEQSGPMGVSLKEQIDQGLRSFCERGGASADNYVTGVMFTNNFQSACEDSKYGIPMWVSADPYRFSDIPDDLTIAVTFDPEEAKKAANYLAKGWRSVGITCELGPEIDVASNPAYSRFSGCFSDDPALTRDMTIGFADGLQSTWGDNDCTDDQGWGSESVSAMCKHYPGDAACEGGRNSHNRTGEFCVYPNDNIGVGLVPYVDGGLRLEGKTGSIASIMPNYAILYSDDKKYGDNVATAYNKYALDLIRNAGWDGVICTDWQISQDTYFNGAFEGRHFGVDDLTPEQRIALGYESGTDQFGGEFQPDEMADIIKNVQDELGEDGALENYRESARRLFQQEMNLGLFENPYIDRSNSKAFWESQDAANFSAELLPKCVVMLKNKNNVIKDRSGSKPKVYIPMEYKSAGGGFNPMGPASDPTYTWELPVDQDAVSDYIDVVTDTLGEPTGATGSDGTVSYNESDCTRASAEDIAACDFVLVFADGPTLGEGSRTGEDGTVTYLPMNLTYGSYTADGGNVRDPSIAGETLADGTKENRSYKGQTNEGDTTELDKILYAKSVAGDVPVVVAIASSNPMIFSEFEDQVDAILYTPLANDGTAIAKIAGGSVEPSGLLPYDMPSDMDTVEANAEDTPRDLEVYKDSEGNSYAFAYGLNWSGVIDDDRTKKYQADPVLTPQTADVL